MDLRQLQTLLGVQTPKNENPTKPYEDKVLKNEASEKDPALRINPTFTGVDLGMEKKPVFLKVWIQDPNRTYRTKNRTQTGPII